MRERPEYIIVGEIRGAEAYVLFQAMATGHTTYSTFHADSIQSLVHRLENKPIEIPRVLIPDWMVFLFRFKLELVENVLGEIKGLLK